MHLKKQDGKIRNQCVVLNKWRWMQSNLEVGIYSQTLMPNWRHKNMAPNSPKIGKSSIPIQNMNCIHLFGKFTITWFRNRAIRVSYRMCFRYDMARYGNSSRIGPYLIAPIRLPYRIRDTRVLPNMGLILNYNEKYPFRSFLNSNSKIKNGRFFLIYIFPLGMGHGPCCIIPIWHRYAPRGKLGQTWRIEPFRRVPPYWIRRLGESRCNIVQLCGISVCTESENNSVDTLSKLIKRRFHIPSFGRKTETGTEWPSWRWPFRDGSATLPASKAQSARGQHLAHPAILRCWS